MGSRFRRVGLGCALWLGGCASMETKLSREVAALGLQAPPAAEAPVTEAAIAPLPEPARRYFAFMRVVGRPRDGSFRLTTRIDFRMRPDADWVASRMDQFNARLDVARVFHMQTKVGGLPVYVRDTYVGGNGRMLGKMFDLVTVVDESGEKLNLGELVTYLNDAVFFAPSFLLVPAVGFEAVDERSFDVTLEDRGTKVRARVFVDERGAPVNFSTTDRFVDDPWDERDDMVRAEWTTPVAGWREVDGRMLMTEGSAVWKLPKGDFAYARFAVEPGDLVHDRAP